MKHKGWVNIGLAWWLAAGIAQAATNTPAALYQQQCAACHGPTRLGGTGPALIPESLARLRKPAAQQVIQAGRPATQMAGFGGKLSEAQITGLLEYIYSPLATPPVFETAQIKASQLRYHDPKQLSAKPLFSADPQNLFVVVESGDHHASILDGDQFTVLTRFPTRFAVHGGPKFSPDGRFVYFVSRDGWISQYDLFNFKLIAEIRVGINSRNLAMSDDGRVLAVANYLPHTLVLLAAEGLDLLRVVPLTDRSLSGAEGKESEEGQRSSRASAVYTAPPRHSFVLALKDLPAVWEIAYDSPDFPIRRLQLTEVLDDFFFNQDYTALIGAARGGQQGQVINLVTGQKIADLDLPGMPHLGSGITWEQDGQALLATPHLEQGVVSIINMDNWQVLKRIETLGPGFFMRSHDNSPYIWVDVFFGKNKDVMHLIDKKTLTLVKTLRPVPGKTAAHIEFDRYGRYALLSIWEQEGAVIVYDAKTLQEIKRLPMSKPSGKYNVYNKTHYVRGTSH